MKISLVLSGGGARGAYHLGVLQYIKENNIEIEAISGSSIGAVIGTFYAAGISPQKQLELFQSKQFKQAIQFNWFDDGLFCFNQQNKIFDQLLPFENLEDLPIKVYITAIDLYSEKTIIFDKGKIIPLCLGTSALPFLFKPIDYDTLRLIDGGVTENLPIEPLLHHKNPIIAVNLHPLKRKKENNGIFTILKNSVRLSWLYSVQHNVRQADCLIENENIVQHSIINTKNMDTLFVMGYDDANEILSVYLKNNFK